MKIRVVRPKLPQFEGNVKVEKWGWWYRISPYHDPVFIVKLGNVPNF